MQKIILDSLVLLWITVQEDLHKNPTDQVRLQKIMKSLMNQLIKNFNNQVILFIPP